MLSIATQLNQLSKRRQRCLKNIDIALLAIVFTALTGTMASNADIYSWTDKNGNTVYTDKKPAHNAKADKPLKKVNSYSPNKVVKTIKLSPEKKPTASTSNTTIFNTTTTNNEGPNSDWKEEQCQENYGHSCDQIINWKTYAKESCGNDSRCKNEQYLERKYKPVTIEQLQTIARRAAIRNNRQSDEITQFLRRKYTNYCDTQASLSCKNDSSCNQIVLNTCKDTRSLEDIFSQYNKLTLQEKNKIITQARALSMGEGENKSFYNKRLADLLSLLVTQTLLGF